MGIEVLQAAIPSLDIEDLCGKPKRIKRCKKILNVYKYKHLIFEQN